MESIGPEDSKNVKTSQAYFFEGFISFFEDFSLTKRPIVKHARNETGSRHASRRQRGLQVTDLYLFYCIVSYSFSGCQ